MCYFNQLQNKFYTFFDFIILFLIAVIHLVFYFIIKETDFGNLFDVFESSPLFNFAIDKANCGKYDSLTFHVWEGRKEYYYYYDYNGQYHSKTKIVDKTEIKQINGYYFCYSHKSYKDLLYNGQIKKYGELCQGTYPNDCGIIDTLDQHLCIKDGEKCPLYDVGIKNVDEPINNNIYEYVEDADIYYNNDAYNLEDKKIIGKLILNDGRPCYRLNEILWRKFISEEVDEEHLECELEVFGVTTDNRYKKKGDITYKKFYESLGQTSQNMLNEKIKGDEYVSLYKREFLGIDKECDEKTDIKKEDYEKLRKAQKMERVCVLVEAIIILCFWVVLFIIYTCIECKSYSGAGDETYVVLFVFLVICFLLNLICIICQSVFLGRIIIYDLSYDCSDKITNEVLRLENLNTKKSIKYTAINLGLDIFYILFHIFSVLLIFLIEKIKDWKHYNFNKPKKPDFNNNININNLGQNKFNADKIDKEPVREVIVNNEKPNIANQFDKPVDNNINQNNANNVTNPYPTLDLGVPPPIEQGYNSNANL